MDELLIIAISNTVFAGCIAIFAFALTRVWKNPHVAHMLWLLVLLKLVTPPIIQIPLPTILQNEKPRATFMIDRSPSQHVVYPSQAPTGAFGVALEPAGANPKPSELIESRGTSHVWQAVFGWPFWLLGSWAVGVIIVVYIAWRRHVRLVQILTEARLPDASLVADMAAIAHKLGISTCPQLLLTPARISPLVTCGIWKQTILLPMELIGDMERHQIRSVLAHELAHLKRRDHWIRLFELFVLAVYWWNPLAWWASRQAGQAEEVCCDSWVVWVFPERRRAYGQALLQTLEYLTEKKPIVTSCATTMGRFLLHRRIEMMLNSTFDRSMSKVALFVILLIGTTVLPVAMKPVYSSDNQSERDAINSYANPAATLPAKSLPNAEAALRDDFLVLPIRTDLQRVTGSNFDKSKVLVLINGVKVIKGEDESLDAKALKLTKIWKAIEPFAKGEPSDVVFRVWCDQYVRRSFADGSWPASSILIDTLEGFGRHMGFQDTRVDLYHLTPNSEYKDDWKRAVADFAPRPGDKKVDEPGVGDKQVKLYPVRTRLSRLLYGNADCVVHFVPPIEEVDVASAIKTMKRCLPQLGLKKKDRVTFFYHWKKPRIADQIRDDLTGKHVYQDMLGFKTATWMPRN